MLQCGRSQRGWSQGRAVCMACRRSGHGGSPRCPCPVRPAVTASWCCRTAARSFASETGQDVGAQAKEALKAEAEDAKRQAKKIGKGKKHAFFLSWYVLIAAGVLRWYQKKLKEKNVRFCYLSSCVFRSARTRACVGLVGACRAVCLCVCVLGCVLGGRLSPRAACLPEPAG